MGVKFSIDDKNDDWDKIEKQTKKLDKSFTKVGVQAGESDDEGEDLISIAASNEFGTKKIPERSFLRSGIDENDKQINKVQAELWGKIMDLKLNPKKAIFLLGEFGQVKVQEKITKLRDPKNSDVTIKLKGSSNPLIDTGQLRASISHVDEL